MKMHVVLTVAIFACVAAEAPPIPYATATSGQPVTFTNEHVGNQYVEHFGPDGFNIQSGYESYLIPTAEHALHPLLNSLDIKSHGLVFKVFRNVAALAWKILPKVAVGAVVLFALFLVGGCVNALICTFTPICTISFLGLGVNKETMRSYLTPDRISSTASFVVDAIKKYKDMYETSANEIEIGKKSDK